MASVLWPKSNRNRRWRKSLNRPRRAVRRHLERGFDAFAERFQHLNARGVLVVSGHQYPRRISIARALDHVAHRHFVIVPPLAVTPVVGRDLEAFERRLL